MPLSVYITSRTILSGEPDYRADGFKIARLINDVSTRHNPEGYECPPLVEPAGGAVGDAINCAEDRPIFDEEGDDSGNNVQAYLDLPGTWTQPVTQAKIDRYTYVAARRTFALTHGIPGADQGVNNHHPTYEAAVAFARVMVDDGLYANLNGEVVPQIYPPNNDEAYFENILVYGQLLALTIDKPCMIYLSPCVLGRKSLGYYSDSFWRVQLAAVMRDNALGKNVGIVVMPNSDAPEPWDVVEDARWYQSLKDVTGISPPPFGPVYGDLG